MIGLIPLSLVNYVGIPTDFAGYEMEAIELDWFYEGEVQGLATDGSFLFLTACRTFIGSGNATLYKLHFNGTYIDSVVIQTGNLTHSGGIYVCENLIWIPLAEHAFTPSESSLIVRYSLDLEYVDSFCNSSATANDHWGSVFVDQVNQRVFIGSYDTLYIHQFDMNGSHIETYQIPDPIPVQDWITVDRFAFGSFSRKRVSGLSIWDISNPEDQIQEVGSLTIPNTDRGIAYLDGLLYACTGVDDVTLWIIQIDLAQ
ncbi:MAG: hypothetical protein GF411_20165 [Candidatus Lokiarchaeota archaeon]|nr:hypothetical protein [Candidatus Lokiarchaeota archaeon]